MSEDIDALRNMLITFRVSELQMLLGYAGRNKTGRKSELQQRAFELLRVRSFSIHQKIKELYKTIQHSGGITQSKTNTPPPSSTAPISPNMPQHHANIPRAAVNPFNIDTRSYATRSTAAAAAQIYHQHQNMYQQQQQQQQSQYQNAQYQAPRAITPNANNYPVHPDVLFKRLPFFDVLAELIKPSSLIPNSGARVQDGNFYFHLTPQQANEIALSRDVRQATRSDFYKQIQMRFCLMETTCKQEDCFPPGLIVKVNNKQCPLPNPVPTNKPGVEPKRPPRPVNITPYIKLSPTSANVISVQWVHDYGRAYAITVAMVHKQTSMDLLHRMKMRGPKHADITRGIIKEKLTEDADNEIATTSLRVSLMCPLGKMRMANPCRARTCNHLQCFDALLYLQMNERKPTWNCPVCDKVALYDDLDIDGYFQMVLNAPEVGPEVKEIQLHKDGSWSVQADAEMPAPVVKPAQKISLMEESIEIIDDDEAPPAPIISNATSSTDSKLMVKRDSDEVMAKAGAVPAQERSVVDLTLSDSDDEEPLAKRRAIRTKPDSTNKSDSTSVSSNSNQSRVSSVTPGPASVSSSGYPLSPMVIALDSPSPPASPNRSSMCSATAPVNSCMLANGGSAPTGPATIVPSMGDQDSIFGASMLNLPNEAFSMLTRNPF